MRSGPAGWTVVEIVINYVSHDVLALVYIWRRDVSVPVLPSRQSRSKYTGFSANICYSTQAERRVWHT
jgi:hypothetical protein